MHVAYILNQKRIYMQKTSMPILISLADMKT